MHHGIKMFAILLATVLVLASCHGSDSDETIMPTNPAGSLDTAFGTYDNGKVIAPIGSGYDYATSVAFQTDGKIVVAGYSSNGSNDDFAVMRFNADGTPDDDFGAAGKVITPIGMWDYAYGVAIQADGKIVVAGCSSADSYSYYDFALVRYTAAGAPDDDFGSSGHVTTPIGSYHDEAYSVAIQADGKIVAAGRSSDNTNTYGDFVLARYTTTGSLDGDFGSSGKVTDSTIGSGNDYATSIAIQTDGKIVVAGRAYNGSNYDFALARYTSTGAVDTDFGSGGKRITPIGAGNDYATSVAIQPDGKIIVAGYSHNGSNYDFALARYTASGALDDDFDTDGTVTTPIGSGNDLATGVAVQSNGKIIAAGYSQVTNYDFALVRYNEDGSLDDDFGTDGMVTTAIGSGIDEAYGIALHDGKIVVAGYSDNGSNYDFALVRYWQ